jgi:hypothetical protein
MYVYMYVCIYIYIYIYTDTHTSTQDALEQCKLLLEVIQSDITSLSAGTKLLSIKLLVDYNHVPERLELLQILVTPVCMYRMCIKSLCMCADM